MVTKEIIGTQAEQILKYLLIHETMTTVESREHLGIMHPGGRISELREAEWPIKTNRYKQTDAAGVVHDAAQYYLPPEILSPEQKKIAQAILAD